MAPLPHHHPHHHLLHPLPGQPQEADSAEIQGDVAPSRDQAAGLLGLLRQVRPARHLPPLLAGVCCRGDQLPTERGPIKLTKRKEGLGRKGSSGLSHHSITTNMIYETTIILIVVHESKVLQFGV